MIAETTKKHRIILSVTAVLAGVFMVFFAPSLAMHTLKTALREVMIRLIPFDPDFYPAVPVLSVTFSIWIIGLWIFGAFSFVFAKLILKGSKWARSLLLGFAGFASVAGATMFIPWMVLVVADYSKGPVPGVLPPPKDVSVMPPVIWIMLFGLVFYYIFLLTDKDTIKNKLKKIIPYTLIGLVAGMVFMNGQHGVRYLIFIPEQLTPNPPSQFSPLGNIFTNLDYYNAMALTTISQKQLNSLKPDEKVNIVTKSHKVVPQVVKYSKPVYNPNTLALLLGGYVNYISSFLLIFALPFLALRKKFGYYTVLGVGIASSLASFYVFIVRHTPEWGMGGVLSLLLLLVFLIPSFRDLFVEEEKA